MECKRHIAVLTSGGDSPGMNACLRAITRGSLYRGCRVTGIIDGYQGLLTGNAFPLTSRHVGGIIDHGGTFLGTSRCPEFKKSSTRRRGYLWLEEQEIDALVVIGGNGSLAGVHDIALETDIKVIGVPASIDNDIYGTDNSIGFDTAVNNALDLVDKLRQTADSHHRIFVVEVMGRDSGALAVEVALAGGAEAVLVPEVPGSHDIRTLAEKLSVNLRSSKKKSAVVICAEGAAHAVPVARRLEELTQLECRATVLGHVQRGGSPTSYDRNLASRLGSGAVCGIEEGLTDVMIGLQSNQRHFTPLEKVLATEHSFNHEEYDLLTQLSI